jgi:predicted RNase H-like HicB family nuclease
MPRSFTLEYCLDDGWCVGRLKEVPGVVSQGETISELEENIRDAYQLVTEDTRELRSAEIQAKEISAEAWAVE